uniref:Uncharacterized protein n=1 Tax=Utricularia reniformis TaxID=192314 RepID=A0A1Y0B4D6_9LAMI|nr:hypothetical protein AEK19_MT2099 [Utricularia reniformis]ART32253.1 hypothetical protein AEK19_MT2099 [Utricularia reniformis]
MAKPILFREVVPLTDSEPEKESDPIFGIISTNES